ETGSFSAAASDVGVNDTLTYTWDFGDGTPTVSGANVTHAFADEGVYTVTLTVSDGDGGTAVQTLEVTVDNVDPIITSLDGDTSVDVGTAASFTAAATDAGSDTLAFSWDFGDGSPTATGANVAHT